MFVHVVDIDLPKQRSNALSKETGIFSLPC